MLALGHWKPEGHSCWSPLLHTYPGGHGVTSNWKFENSPAARTLMDSELKLGQYDPAGHADAICGSVGGGWPGVRSNMTNSALL
jgi:hypothetical protein